MQFNSHATSQDIVSDIKFWCGISSSDSTSFAIADMTRSANMALDRVSTLIMRSDRTWQWDDQNQTDLPTAKANLVANQQDYSLATTHLKITRVRIKDSGGTWKILTPVDKRTLGDGDLNAGAGTPTEYDVLGNSVFLYPKPSYSSSSGLELTFQRGASFFTTGDTTKEPGFASPFHRLVSLYPSLDYCEKNDLDKRAAKIQNKITQLEAELIEYFSSRHTDDRPRLSLHSEDYTADGQGRLTSSKQFDI